MPPGPTPGGPGPPGEGTAQPRDPFWDAILGDPIYQAAQKARDYNVQTAHNKLRDLIKQLAINSGFDPTTQMTEKELRDYGSFIDDTTRSAMAANPFSTKSRLGASLKNSNQRLRYALASRGLGGSGGLAAGQSVYGMQYDRGTHDELQKLLGALQGDIGDYTGTVAAEDKMLRDIAQQVATRLAGNPAAGAA